MSMTIAGLAALAVAELARHAPEMQRAAADFIRENKHVVKQVVKCTDWKKVGADVKDTVKAASDYAKYKDGEGGWDKK